MVFILVLSILCRPSVGRSGCGWAVGSGAFCWVSGDSSDDENVTTGTGICPVRDATSIDPGSHSAS